MAQSRRAGPLKQFPTSAGIPRDFLKTLCDLHRIRCRICHPPRNSAKCRRRAAPTSRGRARHSGRRRRQGRLLTGDFERDAINPTVGNSPQPAIAGSYFHLGRSVFRNVHNLRLPGEIRVKCRFRAPGGEIVRDGFLLLELADLAYVQFEEEAQGFGPALFDYLEATYIGGADPSKGDARSANANGGPRIRDFRLGFSRRTTP